MVYLNQRRFLKTDKMDEVNANQAIGKLGEAVKSQLSWMPMDLTPMEAGSMWIPVKMSSQGAHEYSAIQLIKADLEFANECLREADKLGMPNDDILSSKALIFSGIIAYARAFGTGARGISFVPDDIIKKGVEFDSEIHLYLLNLRSKHVAHSVNAFEECDTVGMVVRSPGKPTRPNAIGFVMKRSIGLSRKQLMKSTEHIANLVAHLEAEIVTRRITLFDELKASYAAGDKMMIAPIVKVSDRAKVGQKRKSARKNIE